jgi:hypothetical protein
VSLSSAGVAGAAACAVSRQQRTAGAAGVTELGSDTAALQDMSGGWVLGRAEPTCRQQQHRQLLLLLLHMMKARQCEPLLG